MNRRLSLRLGSLRCIKGLASLAMLFVLLAPASLALAHQDEPDEVIVDARMEGYPTELTMPESSTGGTWVLFVLLMAITAGGLFKDAKRTHLD